MFTDRTQAGQMLARELSKYRGEGTIVLALPRGGVPVGVEIARELGCPLDIVSIRKIGHPDNPEFALCVVDEEGTFICGSKEHELLRSEWILRESERQQAEAKRRSILYRGERRPADVEGKTVIIVDDGIATGLTMQLAARIVREQRPHEIIVAVPAAPPEAVVMLEKEADEAIILDPPEEFRGAVGAHYEDFPQVSDEEVIRTLEEHATFLKAES